MVRRLELSLGAFAAVLTGAAIVLIYDRDRAQVPPSDYADAVATFAILGCAIAWALLRWLAPRNRVTELLKAAALGVVVGALIVGLGSVVYDPWTS